MTSGEAPFASALAFLERFQDACSTRIVPFSYGTALFNDDFPGIWDMNFARARPSETLSAVKLTESVDEAQRKLGHRKVTVEDAHHGGRLAPGMADLGWRVDRFVLMGHLEEPERTSGGRACELSGERHRAARRESSRREPWGTEEDVLEQLVRKNDVYERVLKVRYYGAEVEDDVAAFCELYSDGHVAQIEDVSTLEEHRGQGLATDVVLAALETALAEHHELVVLVADDEDWPKEMYWKLGFRHLGYTYSFLKAESLPPKRAPSGGLVAGEEEGETG